MTGDLVIGSYLNKRGIRRYHLSHDSVVTLCGLIESEGLVFASCPNKNAMEHSFMQDQGCSRCRDLAAKRRNTTDA